MLTKRTCLQMANSLYDNNANKDGELSPVTPAMVMPSLEYPVEGVTDTVLYLGQYLVLSDCEINICRKD